MGINMTIGSVLMPSSPCMPRTMVSPAPPRNSGKTTLRTLRRTMVSTTATKSSDSPIRRGISLAMKLRFSRLMTGQPVVWGCM